VSIDFQPPKSTKPTPRKFIRLPLLLLVAGALFLAIFAGREKPVGELQAHTDPAELPAKPPEPPEIRREIKEGTIQQGDTITSLLGDYFSPADIIDLSHKSEEVFPLSRICAGQPYKVCLLEGGFERFEYDIDREEQLIITSPPDNGFEVSRIPITYTVETDLIRGVIQTNLFDAVTESGESAELALALADIFAWDVDFILDIRVGDSFQALVEKRFREGEPAGYGNILAAEFVNQGHTYRAVRFQDGDNAPSFYDPEGNSMRKALLKAPLAFTRISSGYSLKRFHPITKTWKAHPAIDYAAPVGTPIKTVGDGTILRIGYTRGNGNFIKIRHNSNLETMYLHMSRFAKGMKKGKKVAQGQTIGYVGSTGLATGPHLCFRMFQNGAPANPARVKAKPAAPVSAAHRAEFDQMSGPLLARLDRETPVLEARTPQSPPPAN